MVPPNTRPEANNTKAPVAVLTPGTTRSKRPKALDATVPLGLFGSTGSPGMGGPWLESDSETPWMTPE